MPAPLTSEEREILDTTFDSSALSSVLLEAVREQAARERDRDSYSDAG